MDSVAAVIPPLSTLRVTLSSLHSFGTALALIIASLFTAILYFLRTSTNLLKRKHYVELTGNENGAPVSDTVSMPFMEMIKTKCPSLYGPKAYFKPCWWLPGGHLQTIWVVAAEIVSPWKVPYTRHHLRTVDGGTVSLDVYPDFEGPEDDTPILFILHGLTGNSQESYIRDTVKEVVRSKVETGKGFRVVAMNFRGCDVDTPVTSNRLYHAGETDDTRTALLWLSHIQPNAALYGAGYSMGAGTIGCYLGQEGDATPLKGVASVSNPWNWVIATGHIEDGTWMNRYIYGPILADALLTMFKNSRYAFETDKRFNMKEVYSRRYVKIRWFDDRVTSWGFGFKDAIDYYTQVSSEQYMDDIKVPHLSMHSKDDPMVAPWNLPYEKVKKSSHVIFATTHGGGHVAWFEGRGKDGALVRWFGKPIREFVEAIHELDPKPKPAPPALPVDAKGFIRSAQYPDRVGFKEIDSIDGLMTGRIYNRTAHNPIAGS